VQGNSWYADVKLAPVSVAAFWALIEVPLAVETSVKVDSFPPFFLLLFLGHVVPFEARIHIGVILDVLPELLVSIQLS